MVDLDKLMAHTTQTRKMGTVQQNLSEKKRMLNVLWHWAIIMAILSRAKIYFIPSSGLHFGELI